MKKNGLATMGIILLLLLAGPSLISAQTAESIDQILEEDRVSFGAAAYLLLVADGEIGDDTGFESAGERFQRMYPSFAGWDVEGSLSLGEFSYLLMRSAGESGGLLYRFFPGPRYAVRELAFQKVVQRDPYPNAAISGEEALRILERFITMKDTEEDRES